MRSWFVSLFDWPGDRGRKASSCRGGGAVVGRPIRGGCIALSRLADREVCGSQAVAMSEGIGQEVAPTSRFNRRLAHPEKSGRRESDTRYRGVSGRHRPRRLLAQHLSANSDSLDMSRVHVDSSEVRGWGWSLAQRHLHLGETRRSAAGAALIFLDERERLGLLEEVSE